MDERNLTYMFYGFLSAWVILAGYVVTLAAREGRINRQIENLRRMIEGKESSKL